MVRNIQLALGKKGFFHDFFKSYFYIDSFSRTSSTAPTNDHISWKAKFKIQRVFAHDRTYSIYFDVLNRDFMRKKCPQYNQLFQNCYFSLLLEDYSSSCLKKKNPVAAKILIYLATRGIILAAKSSFFSTLQ